MVSTADERAKLWRSSVEAAAVRVKSDFASNGLPGWLGGAVSVAMTFMFATPKKERWNQPHTFRPDSDNIAKLVMDVMERVGLLPKGDARVATLEARKIWAKVGGVIVVMKPIDDDIDMMPYVGTEGPEWLTA